MENTSNISSIVFKSKIVPVKPINSQMTLCKCYIMALGKNANRSIITKEATEKALPTLFNIPVVGHVYVDDDNNYRMGGHDVSVEKNKDGKYVFKKLTVPYGTVPEQKNITYEEVKEDGDTKIYQVADIILWTGRYPELLECKYNEDIYFSQSMEIIPTKISKDGEYTKYEEFEYSALCLLGKSDDSTKNIEPCFKSARVEPYEFSKRDEAWEHMFEEFNSELAKCYSNSTKNKEGGKPLSIENYNSILKEFNLEVVNEIPSEHLDKTEEELRKMFSEEQSSNIDNLNTEFDTIENINSNPVQAEESDPVGLDSENLVSNEDEVINVDEENSDEFQKTIDIQEFANKNTFNRVQNILMTGLQKLWIADEKIYERYYLNDFDEQYAFVHHYIAQIEDGKATEAEENLKVKYIINEDEAAFDFENSDKVELIWLTTKEQDLLKSHEDEFNSLKEYKAKRIEDDKNKEFSAVLKSFSDLEEIDEYKEVVSQAMNFSSKESLEEKLYAIRGKNIKKVSKKPVGTIKIPVIGFENESQNDESLMGKFMQTYSKQ